MQFNVASSVKHLSNVPQKHYVYWQGIYTTSCIVVLSIDYSNYTNSFGINSVEIQTHNSEF